MEAGTQQAQGPLVRRKRRLRNATEARVGPLGQASALDCHQQRWNGLYLLHKTRALNNAGLAPPMPFLFETEPLRLRDFQEDASAAVHTMQAVLAAAGPMLAALPLDLDVSDLMEPSLIDIVKATMPLPADTQPQPQLQVQAQLQLAAQAQLQVQVQADVQAEVQVQAPVQPQPQPPPHVQVQAEVQVQPQVRIQPQPQVQEAQVQGQVQGLGQTPDGDQVQGQADTTQAENQQDAAPQGDGPSQGQQQQQQQLAIAGPSGAAAAAALEAVGRSGGEEAGPSASASGGVVPNESEQASQGSGGRGARGRGRGGGRGQAAPGRASRGAGSKKGRGAAAKLRAAALGTDALGLAPGGVLGLGADGFQGGAGQLGLRGSGLGSSSWCETYRQYAWLYDKYSVEPPMQYKAAQQAVQAVEQVLGLLDMGDTGTGSMGGVGQAAPLGGEAQPNAAFGAGQAAALDTMQGAEPALLSPIPRVPEQATGELALQLLPASGQHLQGGLREAPQVGAPQLEGLLGDQAAGHGAGAAVAADLEAGQGCGGNNQMEVDVTALSPMQEPAVAAAASPGQGAGPEAAAVVAAPTDGPEVTVAAGPRAVTPVHSSAMPETSPSASPLQLLPTPEHPGVVPAPLRAARRSRRRARLTSGVGTQQVAPPVRSWTPPLVAPAGSPSPALGASGGGDTDAGAGAVPAAADGGAVDKAASKVWSVWKAGYPVDSDDSASELAAQPCKGKGRTAGSRPLPKSRKASAPRKRVSAAEASAGTNAQQALAAGAAGPPGATDSAAPAAQGRAGRAPAAALGRKRGRSASASVPPDLPGGSLGPGPMVLDPADDLDPQLAAQSAAEARQGLVKVWGERLEAARPALVSLVWAERPDEAAVGRAVEQAAREVSAVQLGTSAGTDGTGTGAGGPGIGGPAAGAGQAGLGAGMAGLALVHQAGGVGQAGGAGEQLVDPDDILLDVVVHGSGRADAPCDELLVLASQKVSELRDAISCVADEVVGPSQGTAHRAYMFMEGTFYNDTRRPDAQDHVRPIVDLCRLQEVWPTHFEARREFKVHVVKQQPQAQTQQQQQGHQPPQQEQGQQGQQQQSQGQQQQTATTSGARPAAGAEDAGVEQQDQEQGQVHEQRQVQGRPVPALGGSTQARDAVVRHDSMPLPSGAAPAQLVEPGVRPMEETRLGELSLRLSNWPCYLYCHLGCCEHLLLIRDVRRVHPADPQTRSSYPLRLLNKAPTRRTCDLCERAPGAKVSFDDPLAPVNPCYYCTSCFNMMHMDASGARVKPEVKIIDSPTGA